MNNSTKYIYSAAGAKLAKKQNGAFKQFYAGSLVYNESRVLDYILNEEGMVVKSGGGFKYQYYLKDHLGNIRVTFEPSATGNVVVQTADYYPFGSRFEPFGVNAYTKGENKYLYNGKELQEELGLDIYDFTGRTYDPEVPRFWQIDPLAESFPWQSPYCYAANNPIKFIDKNGNNPEIPPYARAAVSQLRNTTPAVSTRVSQPNLIRVTPQSSQQPMATISQAPSSYTKFVDTHYSPEIRQQFSTDMSLPLAATAVAVTTAIPAVVTEAGLINETLQTGASILYNSDGVAAVTGALFGYATDKGVIIYPQDAQPLVDNQNFDQGSFLTSAFNTICELANSLFSTQTTSTTTNSSTTNTTTTNANTNSITNSANSQEEKKKSN